MHGGHTASADLIHGRQLPLANEIGWTHGWITTTLALRHRKTSLWDLTNDNRIARQFDNHRSLMLPHETLKPGAAK